MVEKRKVNLSLDGDLVDELKEKGYNISMLCNQSMRTYVSEEFSDIELSAKLGAIDMEIDDKKTSLLQKQLEYEAVKRELDLLVSKRISVAEDFRSAQKTLRLTRLMRDLNKCIIAADFDIEVLKSSAGEVISKIHELSPYFNLDIHVGRFKSIINS